MSNRPPDMGDVADDLRDFEESCDLLWANHLIGMCTPGCGYCSGVLEDGPEDIRLLTGFDTPQQLKDLLLWAAENKEKL